MLPALFALLVSLHAEPRITKTAAELRVAVPRVHGHVRIDGRLDEPMWRHAARLGGFVQYRPLDQVAPSEPSVAYVAYDAHDLYVAFVATEARRSDVRATLFPREQGGGGDDRVTLRLDTFDDHRRAYDFRVTPLGIQSDGVRVEGRGTDFSPDFVWRSAGRVGAHGWTVEIAIPFASLSFPRADTLAIGFNIIRTYARSGERDAWAPRRDGHPCDICQEGVLLGITGIDRGRTVDLLPYLSARQWGHRVYGDTTLMVNGAPLDEQAPRSFHTGAPQGQVGLDVRIAPTSATTVNATINPDFSQVEADAAQVTVGQRFALSYPEQRPFFLEGRDAFQPAVGGPASLGDLLYTRAIVSPNAGVRTTVKDGPYTAAILYAHDVAPAYWWNDRYESSGYETGGEPPAHVAVTRARVDVLDNSYVGAVAMGRWSGNGANAVAGMDLSLQRGAYTLSAEAAGSADHAPLAVGVDTTVAAADTALRPDTSTVLDGRMRRGGYYRVGLSRTGYRVRWSLGATGASDGFRDELGRFPRVGVEQYAGALGASWYTNGDVLQRVDPSISVNRTNVFRGKSLDYAVSPGVNFQFQRQTSLAIGMLAQRVTLPNDSTGRDVPLQVMGYSLRFNTDASSLVSFGFFVFGGQREIYDPSAPRAGVGTIQNLYATLRPVENASLDVSAQRSNHYDAWGAALVDDARILRLRGTYQFSRALGVRVIGQYANQYSSIDTDPLTQRSVSFGTSALMTYEMGPGSFVYAGYDDARQDYSAPLVATDRPLRTGTELFLKVSYLMRLGS